MRSRVQAVLKRLPALVCASILVVGSAAQAAPVPPNLEAVFTRVRASVAKIRIDTEGDKPQICSSFAVDAAPNILITRSCKASASSKMTVSLPSGDNSPAEFWGDDAGAGISIFHISTKISPVRWADAPAKAGEPIAFVGYVWDIGPIITTGTVASEIVRLDGYPAGAIFIDAAVFRGGAGAPVVNLNGDVVGMIGMTYEPKDATRGLGVAMPAADVRRIVQKILDARSQH
jgi:S1-C subfamily serine protease